MHLHLHAQLASQTSGLVIDLAHTAYMGTKLTVANLISQICSAYATGEIFANIPLKIFRPSIWLPCCILAWGTVMTLMGIVQGYNGLIATRFFLGLTEAPFFPGAMFILSNWYRREELQRRISYLYAVCKLRR